MAEEEKKERKYKKYESREAAMAAARRTKHQWDKDNYERTTVYMPIGMNAKLYSCAEKLGIVDPKTGKPSKRAFVIGTLEKAIKETLDEE